MNWRRPLLALCACLLVVLPLGGGALGATSFGRDGTIAFVRVADIVFTDSTPSILGATDPSWSPNGTQIAFVQGTQVKRCTAAACAPSAIGPLGASQPAWSPDSTRIAYVVGSHIHVMSAIDGSGDIAVTSGGSTNTDPSWSADGSVLVFTQNGAIVQAAPTAGANVTAITTGLSPTSQPAWSPDGNTIAFQSSASGTSHIYVVPAGGGTATQVTPTSAHIETAPSWSPQSDALVYADGTDGIMTVTKSGSSWQPPVRTTTTPTDATPGWQTVAPAAGTPSITGGNAPQTGQLLSAQAGSWVGASSFTYQWSRCDSAGANCSNIATGSSYAVVSADIGNTLRVTVTGTNDAGSTTSQPSNQTGVVTQAGVINPPTNTGYPTISLGFNQTSPLVGNFLTATAGTWTGTFPMTFTYQWKRCTSATGDCFDIVGAKSSFFTIPAIYYGLVLRVQVTATNSAGAVSQNSEATPAVTALAPVLRVTPQITGRNVVDQTLALNSGLWEGAPAPTFSYSWRRCDAPGDPSSCVPIAGATKATYVATVADIGSTIRVWITGANQAGSALGITNHTFPVIDKQHFGPSVASSPSIAGDVVIGRQLTASGGSFDGDAPLTSKLGWQRCDATGTACKDITGAKKSTYFPTLADIGYTLRVSVTVTNALGKIVVNSTPTEPVLVTPPHKKGRRIVGKPVADYLAGGGNDDTIFGMGGNDTILGGAGDDRIDGGAGNDAITGGKGADTIFGGDGSDTIYAVDGEQDVIDCGPGRDRAVVDSTDKVTNCEVVTSGTSTLPTPVGSVTPVTPPGSVTPVSPRR